MPRKNPLPENELAIGQRLARFRTHLRLSRQAVADIAGTPADVLTRVELGRMPLRYEDARSLLPALRAGRLSPLPDFRVMNPLWLVSGEGPAQLEWPLFLPDSDSLGLPYRLAFSEFVNTHRQLLLRLCKHDPEPALPESWLEPYLRYLMSMEGEAGAAYHVLDVVETVFLRSAKELIRTSQSAGRCLDTWLAHKERRPKDFSRKALTQLPESEKMHGVKFEMETILSAVRRLTLARGSKNALAKALVVSPSRVSEWLSGKCEPDGRKALLLLNWVLERRANETEGPGSAATPSEPKTQSKVSNEKKPKSGQKKQ